MSREEIVNNIGYQLTRAAVDYVEKHEFADGMDCFEAGAEWMQKKMIDKLRELERGYEHDLDAEPRVYERDIQICAKLSLLERLIHEIED